eukprot:Pgem_evm1s1470
MIYCDNQAAIKIATEYSASPKIRHVEVKYHFIRKCIADGLVQLEYVRSEGQLTDCMTEIVGGKQFLRLRDRLLYLGGRVGWR